MECVISLDHTELHKRILTITQNERESLFFSFFFLNLSYVFSCSTTFSILIDVCNMLTKSYIGLCKEFNTWPSMDCNSWKYDFSNFMHVFV